MSKLFSVMFLFATFSLMMALFTHPFLGTNGAIWMIAPILIFCPYGLVEALFYWGNEERMEIWECK